MQQTCLHCSAPFTVTEDDLKFYDKISPVFHGKKYQIPPPTLCPECRQQRRMSWRNDRNLYQRTCDFSGKKLISMFSAETPTKVYERDIWFGDRWDPLEYGRDFDFTRPFFAQFQELVQDTPHPHVITLRAENSLYTNYNAGNKNCYLCFAGNYSEDCLYSYNAEMCKNCADSLFIYDSELCYECVQCEKCYNLKFSLHCKNCTDSFFLEDCQSCNNCLLCWNLKNKKFHILNTPYTEEKYFEILKTYQLHTIPGLHQAREVWQTASLEHPKRENHNVSTESCSGEYILHSKNCTECHTMAKGCEDCKYILNGFPELKNSYDCTYAGEKADFIYESLATGENCNMLLFNDLGLTGSANLYYCHYVISSENCFGCAGLRYKKYCILNKQYSQEEYEVLVPRIIEQMRSTGEWGEFFPTRSSPFAYNETLAQEYFPLSSEQVLARQWRWKAEEPFDMTGITKKIPAAKLPQNIVDVPDDVLQWSVICTQSGKPFKIQKSELEFYRKMNLPVPHLHPDIRHSKRMTLRNPRKLWERKCAKCGKNIQTTYSPDRPEMVYCEACYLQTVY